MPTWYLLSKRDTHYIGLLHDVTKQPLFSLEKTTCSNLFAFWSFYWQIFVSFLHFGNYLNNDILADYQHNQCFNMASTALFSSPNNHFKMRSRDLMNCSNFVVHCWASETELKKNNNSHCVYEDIIECTGATFVMPLIVSKS